MAKEKRLIDYQKAIEIALDTLKGKVTTVTAVMLTTRLKGATVDAVKVVRCNDCKWAKSYNRGDGLTGYYCQHQNSTFLYGTNWERIFEPVRESNDFCSYGERREGE